MAPNRFRRDQREKREVTPFTDDKVVPEVPPEWRDLEAPINFTWVVQDELAGMGWPKSRDQVRNEPSQSYSYHSGKRVETLDFLQKHWLSQ
jgi:hypothetical protein